MTLSVCPQAYHWNETSKFQNFGMLPVSVTLSFSGCIAIYYVLPVLVLWLTSFLQIVGYKQGCRCNTGTASVVVQPGG